MIEREILSIPDFLSRPLWDISNMIFRGVARSSFELQPSIGRVSAISPEARRSYEEEILEAFQEQAHPYLRAEPKNGLEWLMLAQHYGIPTRLLDWTTNPLVALYFAVEKDDEYDGAVYKTIQSKWIVGVEDPFSLEEEFGIRPKHTDMRYVNQSGIFTIHPSLSVQLSTEHSAKYLIPASKKPSFRWELAKYGIKPSFIYPGLDGLAQDILEQKRSLLDGRTVRMNINAPFIA